MIDGLTTGGGLPQVPLSSDAVLDPKSRLTAQNANFDASRWRIVVRGDLFTKDAMSSADATALAATLFHEVRHSEQTFNMLRYVEVDMNNWRFPGISSPEEVVKLARVKPLSSKSDLGIQAKSFYESEYGIGIWQRRQVLTNVISTTNRLNQAINKFGNASTEANSARFALQSFNDSYLALPEEADAFSAAAKMKNQWRH